MERNNPEKVYKEYQSGVQFNTGIDLYDCVQTNENFFIGKQWEGVEAGGMPTPVFNFIKRVVMFAVANIMSDNLKLHASPLSAFPMSMDADAMQGLNVLTDSINDQFDAIFEHNNVGSLLREFVRNAAVDGDGCLYTYWDPDAPTGQDAKGAIRTEVLQNTQVHFGNPNCRDVQSQPYIIVSRRMLVPQAKKRAKANGAQNVDLIVADEKQESNNHMDTLGGNKVTVMLKMWKDDETGTVHAYECTSDVEVHSEWDLGVKLYPIAWMSWDYVQDCYHGQAMVSGVIPNQIFVNKLFAMSMISLMSTAYPKVIYDRTRVPQWTNRVGAAIGVSGPVNDVAKNMDPATISPQISQFIDAAVSYTQSFLGASDVALGDTRPDNAAAIIALQRANATPLELTRQNLLQSIEDMGRIYLEFMGEYYGVRNTALQSDDGSTLMSVPIDFSILKGIPLSVKLDVGASSYWSEIASMQTLDNLLMNGRISTVEYLKRLPAGQISDREALIEILSRGAAPGMDMPADEVAPEEEEPELRGGPGDGGLQRAIRESAKVPEGVM